MTTLAVQLAKEIGGPVFLRSVTSLSQSHGMVEVEPRVLPESGHPLLEHNMEKYTKAGAKICMDQHQDLLNRLEKAKAPLKAAGVNELVLKKKGGLGVVSLGVASLYRKEAFAALEREAGSHADLHRDLRGHRKLVRPAANAVRPEIPPVAHASLPAKSSETAV